MVALNPASCSYGSVPVSKLRPSGRVGAGRALYGRHCQSRRGAAPPGLRSEGRATKEGGALKRPAGERETPNERGTASG